MPIVYHNENTPSSFFASLRVRILKRWPGGVVYTTRNGVRTGGTHIEILSSRTRMHGRFGENLHSLIWGNTREGRDAHLIGTGGAGISSAKYRELIAARKLIGKVVAGRLLSDDDAIRLKHYDGGFTRLRSALVKRADMVNATAGRPNRIPFEKAYRAIERVYGEGFASKFVPADDRDGCAVHVDDGAWALNEQGVAQFYVVLSENFDEFRTASGDRFIRTAVRDRRPSPASEFREVTVNYAARSWLEYNGYSYNDEEGRYVHDDFVSDDDEDGEDEDGLYDYHSSSSRRRSCVKRHPSMEGDALKDDNITLGFEAEIQVPERYTCVKQLNADDVLRKVTVMEHDGSLSEDDGFETITGWSTMPTVVEWGERYCRVVSRQDYYTDGAGLHIAVGGLSQLHVARVYGFVFDRGNRPLLRDMAGRDYNSYSTDFYFMKEVKDARYEWDQFRTVERPAPTAFTSRKITANMAIVTKKSASQGRYSALNYRRAEYAGTLEWRMFEATGNATRMTARLQFVWAVSKYTDPALCNPLTMDGFLHALVTDPLLRRHTEALREYIVRTEAHQCRFPDFARAVTELRQRKEKKVAHIATRKQAETAPA